ncbi:TGF-beta-activated kinase 1 and MAP3K7-binding protein 2 [Patella vulgata]|uniref:TGF-beta-activated kinase 1 and MAP3K7-binding protein 2 n=1 Tax=Patella vulgata TaxID=6465 RepID=UPI00217F3A35|nr:TGF-beta-activated kinase 1 and MAP3K7-binding protein 2 [Patella vulgata]
MATPDREININVQLFKELSDKYPKIPKEIVSTHLRMTGNDRNQCLQILHDLSQQYLYSGGHQANVSGGFGKVNINKSSESKPSVCISNQNTDSFGSWIANTGTLNTGQHTQTAAFTAPVVPGDFDPFVDASNKPSSIPNINCTVHRSESSPSVSQTVKKFEVGSGSSNTTSPVTGKRPVPVIHCAPSKPSDIGPGALITSSTSYQIHTKVNSGGTCTVVDPLHSKKYHIQQETGQTSMNSSPNKIHSSQAKIMINQPNNGHHNPETSYVRKNQYPPSVYSKPLFVQIKSSGPEGSETHLKYNYSPNVPENQLPSYVSPNVVSAQNRYPPNQYPPTPSLHVAPVNQTSISPNSSPYISYPTSAGINPHLSSRTNSVESEHNVFVAHGEMVHPMGYAMSPASSHSSLSSESSAHIPNPRPSSGSSQEDKEYVRALLYHQRQRLENLKRDYNETKKETEKLRHGVAQMEKNMLENSNRRNSFPTIEDVTKLREENRRLQTDIQCMGNEVDTKKNGQGPFSIIDPIDQQNFFKNMPTGPSGPIGSRPPRPPVPPPPHISTPPGNIDINQVPPVPPRQPSAGSGDSEEGEQWNCSACTFLNHPALNKCECCEMPRIGS